MNAKNVIAALIVLIGLFVCLAGFVHLHDRANTVWDVVTVIFGLGLCIFGRILDRSAKKGN